MLGGQRVAMRTGRRLTYYAEVERYIPNHNDSVSVVLARFAATGVDAEGAVALMGAHSVGRIHCFNLVGQLYPSVDAGMDLDVLLNLVCIGTLFVFYMVANAVVYRRYVGRAAWLTLAFLLAFSLLAVSFTLVWKLVPQRAGSVRTGLLAACGALAPATVAAFQALVPQAHTPELWGVPAMPWVPAASVFLNVFLLGSLDRASYVRFAVFSAAAVLVYALYSVHASYDAKESSALDSGGGRVVDERCEVKQ